MTQQDVFRLIVQALEYGAEAMPHTNDEEKRVLKEVARMATETGAVVISKEKPNV